MFTFDELLTAAGGRPAGAACRGRIAGIATDSRAMRPRCAFIAIRGDSFDGHSFVPDAFHAGAAAAIIEERSCARTVRALRNAGLGEAPLIIVRDSVAALGKIAGYHRRRFDIPVIAVTGSNGKTTTKDMIAWVLSGRFNVLKTEGNRNNHIGLPLTLLRLRAQHEALVVELGSNHPGEIAYLADMADPSAAVITNVGPAHLEFFKDLAGVMKEKWSLAQRVPGAGLVVLNADDPLLRPKLGDAGRGGFAVGFGIARQADFRARAVRLRGGICVFGVNAAGNFSLRTHGLFNVYNALAAIVVARVMGMDYRKIRPRLASFPFPADRLALLEQDGVQYINDSYNANPASLKQALDVLAAFRTAGRRILVMGDMMELGPRRAHYHRAAAGDIAKSCDVVIAVGNLSRLAAGEVKRLGFDDANVFTCSCAAKARELLRGQVAVTRDDVVLLKGSRAMKLEQVVRAEV